MQGKCQATLRAQLTVVKVNYSEDALLGHVTISSSPHLLLLLSLSLFLSLSSFPVSLCLSPSVCLSHQKRFAI